MTALQCKLVSANTKISEQPQILNLMRYLSGNKAELLHLKPHPFICTKNYIGKKDGNQFLELNTRS